ncbi:hypothetical protein Ancab_031173 [Ancistrocladus abbreviatus]
MFTLDDEGFETVGEASSRDDSTTLRPIPDEAPVTITTLQGPPWLEVASHLLCHRRLS